MPTTPPKAAPPMPNDGQQPGKAAPTTPPKAAPPPMPNGGQQPCPNQRRGLAPSAKGTPLRPPDEREQPPQWFCDEFLVSVQEGRKGGKTQSRRRGPNQNNMEMKKYWEVLQESRTLKQELTATQTQAGAGDWQ